MKEPVNGNSQRLLDALQRTVNAVLETMAWSEVAFLGVEREKNFLLDGEACGMVFLYGGHEGVVGVCCDRELAKELVAGITGLPSAEIIEEDLLDGMGELANMIGGGMKTKSEMADIILSPPMTVVGSAFRGVWKTDHPTHVLNFQVEGRPLQVMASL